MSDSKDIRKLFFSCQKANVLLAIELAAAQGLDLQAFLRSKQFYLLGLTKPEQFIGLTKLQQHDYTDDAPYCWCSEVQTLNPLRYLYNLQELQFSCDYNYLDTSPLKELVSLKKLSIWQGRWSDLSFLQAIYGLELLDFSDGQVQDLTPLQHLLDLHTLYFSKNQVQDLTPLAPLFGQLEYLNCAYNPIKNIDIVAKFSKLKTLNCSNCKNITNIEALQDCQQLEIINVHNCELENIDVLAKIDSLREIYIQINHIKSIAALCTYRPKLNILYCQNNAIPQAELAHFQELNPHCKVDTL